MLIRSGFHLPARTARPDDWAEMLRDHFVGLDVSDLLDSGFTGAVRSTQTAHLHVASVNSVAQSISRSDSLIRADQKDNLQVGMMRRGRAVVSQDDRECLLQRGDFVLYDTSRPFSWRFDGHPDDGTWSMEVFTWPRAALALSEVDVRRLTAVAFDGRSGSSALLGRFLHDLATLRMSDDADTSTGAIIDEVGDLVNAILRSSLRTDTHPHTDLYRSAIAQIDERIADPGVSPVEIAAALSISTRQLHRVFAEQDTTVSRTIRRRRLERCRRDIVADTGAARSLLQISRRWGFSDLAVFSRAFKQEYGVSPRHYRSTLGAETGLARR
ncbi:helix-turn-helix domain-containing protein [Gordonia sp. CPCC 205515]|uniref:helix-turn-helix domain-containing protein n=1 Tax=Gordonia sp. CPCC 205515 TaxID=3140791 RepID=UPI003AF357A0